MLLICFTSTIQLHCIIASVLDSQNIAKYNKNLDGGSVECPSQCSLVSHVCIYHVDRDCFPFQPGHFSYFFLFVPLNFATPLYYAVNDSDKSIHVYVYANGPV